MEETCQESEERDENSSSKNPPMLRKVESLPFIIRRMEINPRTGRPNHLLRCSECGKEFAHKNQLLDHLMRHTSDRPFACGRCHVTFSERRSRNRHEINFVCGRARGGKLFIITKKIPLKSVSRPLDDIITRTVTNDESTPALNIFME